METTTRRRGILALGTCLTLGVAVALTGCSGALTDAVATPATSATAPSGPPAEAHCSAPAAPGVNWSGCRIDGVDLTGANLSRANLSGATISGSKLLMANLSNADLTNATLVGDDVTVSNLTGATLTGITTKYLSLAEGVNWSTAAPILPAGWKYDAGSPNSDGLYLNGSIVPAR